MSVGRRGDKTYTGRNGAPTDRLRALDKLQKTPAGSAGQVAAPTPEAIRKFIETQTCPWCGAGPYKLLASHTNRAHGVDRAQLREMAGLVKGALICDPELSRSKSERLKGKRLPRSAYERSKGDRRTYSEAGRAVQRAKLDAVRSPEQARRASAARVAKVTEENAPKYEAILQMFEEGHLIREIADALGVSKPMIRSTLERHGLADDLRKRRWRVLPPEDRDANTERLRQAYREAKATEAALLVERFEATGGTYEAVRELARTEGVAVQSMADRLRKAGAAVPDGRAEAQSRFSEADRLLMCELYAQGLSQSQVAARFGTNQAYVSKLLREQGAATRPFSRWKSP